MGPFCHPARSAAIAGLSAAALIVLAACSAGSKPASTSGSPSAGPAGSQSANTSGTIQMTPGQVLFDAAAKAHQVTSATETLSVRTTGAVSLTTSGTIVFRMKPALLVSGNLTMTVAGTATKIKMYITGKAMYVNEAALSLQAGKPWVQINLSDLGVIDGSTGAGLAQMVQSLQNNDFASQAQLFTAAKNARVVGEQIIDGVPTTEYAGSFVASEAIKVLPAGFRAALTPALRALGNGVVRFHEWVDGQHYLRKITEVETVKGETTTIMINITGINRPVNITLPPASQTYLLQESGPVSGKSSHSGLGAKVVPAPAGFIPGPAVGAPQGPMNAAGFDQFIGSGNPAATLHFVRGYLVNYDSTTNNDAIAVYLFQFATSADATAFQQESLSGAPGPTSADPAIPGAEDYDSTSAYQGTYHHGVFGIKGTYFFVIDDATGSATPVPLVETLARQQYAAL